jgi:hypothetical protein
MSDDNTSWTPSADDNILGITDKKQINLIEATGIAKAELQLLKLDTEVEISAQLILMIHGMAFGDLYVPLPIVIMNLYESIRLTTVMDGQADC